MSRKPIRRKNPTNKYVGFKVFERPTNKRYEKAKFFSGSAFMLLLAGFVMYKSLFASSSVLGVNSTRLIAERSEESDRSVERARESQKKQLEELQKRQEKAMESESRESKQIKMQSGSSSNMGSADNQVACPVTGTTVRTMSAEECKRILEKRRQEVVETQKLRFEQTNERTKRAIEQKAELEKDENETEEEIEDESSDVGEENEPRVKTRFEFEEGRIRIKTSSDSGAETVRDLTENERTAVEKGLEIEGRDLTDEGGKFVIRSGSVRAKSNLPISLDANTNQFVVTTSEGEREVAVLPEQAIANLNARGIVGEVTEESGELEVVDEGGEPVYKVDGVEQRRLFGLLPLQLRSRFSISAVDGSVSQENTNFATAILRAFSF